MSKLVLGVDIGGSGIKGAVVDLDSGELHTDRIKITTPNPSTPGAVAKVVRRLARQLEWSEGPIGFGFPAPILDGVTQTASNIDKAWIKFSAREFLTTELGMPCFLINDADAAGLGELHFGAAFGLRGTVILLTLGTGIGSALFHNGNLVPNTEFGYLMYKDSIVEKYASNQARKAKGLSYSQWGKTLNDVLLYMYRLFYPELFIIGGGISKRFHLYGKYLKPGIPVIPAKNYNDAGIIGAAWYAGDQMKTPLSL